MTALEVESRLEGVLPDEVSMLAAPLASGVQDVIAKQTQEIVASDRAREAWVEANRVAHEKIVELLRGEAGVVYAEGDEIRLNLLPVVSRVVSELRLRFPRLFPGIVTVPSVTAETPAPEAIAQFEEAVGRDLADDFGQITLMQNEKLEQAQRAVELFDRAVWLLVIVTIGLIDHRPPALDTPPAHGPSPGRRDGHRPGRRTARRLLARGAARGGHR